MYMSNSRSNVPQELRNLGVRNMNTKRLILGKRLTYIDPNGKNIRLTELPKEIGLLKKLEYLSLGTNKLTKLPSSIGNLTNLRVLDLGYNSLESLPPQIGNLKNLEDLRLNNNNLKSLPPQIGLLQKLHILDLRYNNLKSLPPQIGLCKNLQYIHLTGNKLKTLPKEIAKLNFERINVTNNPNIRIPYILKNKSIEGGFYDRWHILRTPTNIKYNYTNYYKNQLAVINKKRNNLPSLTRNIKNKIAKQVSNVKPGTKPKIPTKNPFRKLVRRIKEKSKLKRNTENMENIEKVTNRIKSSIKTPNKPNIPNTPNTPNKPNTIRKKAGNAAQSRRNNVNKNIR